MVDFGSLLEEFLKHRGISKAHLAKAAHLSPSYITLLIQGKEQGEKPRQPSLNTVEALANALLLDETQRAQLLVSAGYPAAIVRPLAPTSPDSSARPWLSQGAETPQEAGLIAVHKNLPTSLFRQLLNESRQFIHIQDIWLAEPHVYEDEFFAAAERGVEIKVLLLDPKSDFAKARSKDLTRHNDLSGGNESVVPYQILESISTFTELCTKNSTLKRKLTLRLYDTLPSFPFLMCDNIALVGWFPFGRRSAKAPQLVVSGANTILGKLIVKNFEDLWKTTEEEERK